MDLILFLLLQLWLLSHVSAIICPKQFPDNISLSFDFEQCKRWWVFSSATEYNVTNEQFYFELDDGLGSGFSTACMTDYDYTNAPWTSCLYDEPNVIGNATNTSRPFVDLSYRFDQLTRLFDLNMTIECLNDSQKT
jgi:hypothetical protein